MRTLYQAFLMLLARATNPELAQMLQYAKVEAQILRSKLPRRLEITPQERSRLLKVGKPLGTKLYQLMTIVSPRTFLRWIEGEKHRKPRAKAGRPPIAVDRGLRWGHCRGMWHSQGELPGEALEQRGDYLAGLSGPRCTR